MASSSVKAMIARIGCVSYADLKELKTITIPREEQAVVENEMKKKRKEKKSSIPEDYDSCLAMYEAGSPLKCVRIPKRDQRYAQISIDQIEVER